MNKSALIYSFYIIILSSVTTCGSNKKRDSSQRMIEHEDPVDRFKSIRIGLDEEVLSLEDNLFATVLLYKDNDVANAVMITIPPYEMVDLAAKAPYSIEVYFGFMAPTDSGFRTFSTSYGECKDFYIDNKTKSPIKVTLKDICESKDPTNPRPK